MPMGWMDDTAGASRQGTSLHTLPSQPLPYEQKIKQDETIKPLRPTGLRSTPPPSEL